MLEATYAVSASGKDHRDKSVNSYKCNCLQPRVSHPTGQTCPSPLLSSDEERLSTAIGDLEAPAADRYGFSPTRSPTCSLVSHSSASQYTDTSSQTIPDHGIGSITAKGIRAVGKLQLRAAEWIVIQRNLAELRRLFPHNDDDVNDRRQEAYDTVLELTRYFTLLFRTVIRQLMRPRFRLHLYSDQVRKEALRLVLPQIASENVAHMVKALAKLQPVEVQIFITELMTCLPPEWVGLTVCVMPYMEKA
jgi:hypothetical protein